MAVAVAFPSTVPDWNNPSVELFHGTIYRHHRSILAGINLLAGRPNTDFGRGFYLTTALNQARRRAQDLELRNPGSPGIVIAFRVDRDLLAGLDTLAFVRGDRSATDYWTLVRHCRSGGTGHGRQSSGGWYDVVVGPVALKWTDGSELAASGSDQFGFHTVRSAALLDASPKRVVP